MNAPMIAPRVDRLRQEEAASNNFLLRTVHVVWRQRKRAGLFFVVTMTLIIIGAFVCPKAYESEAKLFVRLGRESVTLDPTATTGKVVGVHETRENEINSVLEVIQSRVILERVVDRLGPAIILDEQLPADVPRNGTPTQIPERDQREAVSSTQRRSDNTKQEKAIRRLQRMVYIKHARKSSVITVGCKAASPELAQTLVRLVLEEFRKVHLRVYRTAGSRKFFEQQSELLAEKLEKAREKLRTAKNGLGITTLGHRWKTLQELVRTNRAAAQVNASELAGVRASIASLKQSLASLPETTVAQRVVGFPNGALDRARSQLNALQLQERQLLTKYTEHHPEVVAVRQQIAEARKILQEREPHSAQSTTATNPAVQQLQVQLHTERARADSLQSKAAALRREYEQLMAQLRELNANEGRIAELGQNVELLQAAHREYSEKLEQARIDWALGEERISNVNVVQPPTYVTKAVSPKKRLIGFLGLIVAGIGSIGIAYLYEFLDRRRQLTHDVSDTIQTAEQAPDASEHFRQPAPAGAV